MKTNNNLLIYHKYMDLIYYSNDIVRKYPKSERFALVEEIIKPYILPKFIYTSFACLSNKGTHKAVNTVQQMMRQ